MGINVGNHEDSTTPAFSRDVLRVEKSGPDEEHLTVIDVPGIFENPSPGITTDADIVLVKGMVKDYIKDSRTIILAVMPCNVDIATQPILHLAKAADPEGKRTLGVLTKPDLVPETANKEAVAELVRGRRRDLALGYYVVRNRGADDKSSSIESRDAAERQFFTDEPWCKLDRSHLGISALRTKLRDLLMDRTRSEFPKVKREIADRLGKVKSELDSMGSSRGDTEEQRQYLGGIADRFGDLKNLGLDAYYTGDPIFSERPELKLVTRMREINEAFSALFFAKAHSREFAGPKKAASANTDNEGGEEPASECDYDDELSYGLRDLLYDVSFSIPSDPEDELLGILAEPFECPDPETEGIMEHIKMLNLHSRGYEIGTVS